MNESIFATPRNVVSAEQCYFYHTMDIPGHGVVNGDWDLRGKEAEYLGNVALHGKKVLEMGTGSGFLCFFMEAQGADVIAYDLSDKDSWDIVPFGRMDPENLRKLVEERKAVIRKLNNGFWFAHKAHNSNAKVVYGPAYRVPDAVGPVDVVTFTSILLHLRDPFLAMQSAARHARESLIVTEKIREKRLPLEVIERLGLPYMRFLPQAERCEPWETWWSLTPELIRRFVRVLGFENTKTTYFKTMFKGKNEWKNESFFTVVAHR
jgi:hypothetical protein